MAVNDYVAVAKLPGGFQVAGKGELMKAAERNGGRISYLAVTASEEVVDEALRCLQVVKSLDTLDEVVGLFSRAGLETRLVSAEAPDLKDCEFQPKNPNTSLFLY